MSAVIRDHRILILALMLGVAALLLAVVLFDKPAAVDHARSSWGVLASVLRSSWG